VSQAEAGIAFLAPQIADYSVSGRVVRAQGNRDPDFAPHGVFRASGADSWVAIVARDDAEWQTLARIVEGDSLAADARFKTLAARKANEVALEEIVAGWTRAREAHAIEVQLQAAGVPAYVVAGTDEFVADPQLLAQQHIRRLPHPHGGESVFEAARYQLSQTPAAYERPAPHFGRDNEYVLGQLLGYDGARIAELAEKGALV
jgi:benzylsuccinate CoA-transferase BbsF subunit